MGSILWAGELIDLRSLSTLTGKPACMVYVS
jgi:hypothetical protein